MMHPSGPLLGLALLLALASAAPAASPPRPNVLLIALDDLNYPRSWESGWTAEERAKLQPYLDKELDAGALASTEELLLLMAGIPRLQQRLECLGTKLSLRARLRELNKFAIHVYADSNEPRLLVAAEKAVLGLHGQRDFGLKGFAVELDFLHASDHHPGTLDSRTGLEAPDVVELGRDLVILAEAPSQQVGRLERQKEHGNSTEQHKQTHPHIIF
jgi:hypothetical protein